MQRREAKAKRQKTIGLVAAGVVVVVAVAAIVWFVVGRGEDSTATANPGDPSLPAGAVIAPEYTGELPPFTHYAGLGRDCEYTPSGTASKPNTPPRAGEVPTDPATVSLSMATDRGNLGLLLNNGQAPCTVNSFISLANQEFFDDTVCHRLTNSPSLSVLQCGDPGGDGTGGPGYRFADEYPNDQYPPNDPELQKPVRYPRGTVAMANSGPGTNGSQFFLVYQDSQLPPNYTVFGTIDETGLATLDGIAKAGLADGAQGDGKPAEEVRIKAIRTD